MAYNLQSDSDDFSDVSEVLSRSRDNWLSRDDVITIVNLHEDPTISLDPVEPFEEGLYLFHEWSVQDNNDWILFDDGHPEKTKTTREQPPMVYRVSRLLLNPIDAGLISTYVKRVYVPNLDVDCVLAHYRIIHTTDGEPEDDTGDDVEEDDDDTEEDTESSAGEETDGSDGGDDGDRGDCDPNVNGNVNGSAAKSKPTCSDLPNGHKVNNGTSDSQTTHLSGGMQVCIQDFIVNCPKGPTIETLQFEKHQDKDQNSENDKDPYGNLLKWLIPLDNTISQPPRSLPPPLIPSPGISSTAHKPAISSTSGSQLFSLGHLRSGVRIFLNSNHQEETIVVSMSMPGFQSHHYAPRGKGYISNSINSQPLVGVPIMSPPISILPAPSSIVGTTDIRFSSKPIGSPAQLTIFYAGSVCVYDDISPEKAKAIMLLAGNGSSMPQAFSPPQTHQQLVHQVRASTYFSALPPSFMPTISYLSPEAGNSTNGLGTTRGLTSTCQNNQTNVSKINRSVAVSCSTPMRLETRTENRNGESSNPSDVIPKSGLGCTHLWLQSRVPLG